MNIPPYLYGTAWKEEQTEACVLQALSIGYRGIDTANQRKHYFEEGVGQALNRAGVPRQDLFLQSKFTFARGQDHRKPYDENASYHDQVQQSFKSSLQHLKTDYLDSYVLHGPSSSEGLTPADWETWASMEELHRAGHVHSLGISNVSLEQLTELFNKAKIKPRFVQNRCFAETRWDQEIRQFCTKNGIIYQAFSLLTANAKFLGGHAERSVDRKVPQMLFDHPDLHPVIEKILRETGRGRQQIIFRFAQQIGMLPLVGCRSLNHLKMNLRTMDFMLTEEQMKALENLKLTP